MTETTLPTREQIDALQAEADSATARARDARVSIARQQEALNAQREQRRLEHVAARADAFVAAPARKAVLNAQRALVTALDADPLIGAFVDWQLARLQEHRLQALANSDALELGRPEPFRGLVDVSIHDLADTLRKETELLIIDRLGQWEAEIQEAFYAATLADLPERTAEEHAAYEAQQETARRRALAVIGPPSIDVTNMTPAKRRELGLPEDIPGRINGSRDPNAYGSGAT